MTPLDLESWVMLSGGGGEHENLRQRENIYILRRTKQMF